MPYCKLTLVAALKATLIASCALTASAIPAGTSTHSSDVDPGIFLGQPLEKLTDFRKYGVSLASALGINDDHTIEVARGTYNKKYEAFIKCMALVVNKGEYRIPNGNLENEEFAFQALMDAGHRAKGAWKKSADHVSRPYVSLDTMGRRCFVYSYDGHEDVLDYIEQGRLDSIADVKTIARGVLRGIMFLHSAGIVHNDIKLENVMLSTVYTTNGIRLKPTLVDFDLASPLRRDGNGVVIPDHNLRGSPPYMPPEALTMTAADLSKKDVWAAGIVVYAMVANSFIFDHRDENKYKIAVMNSKVNGLPWSPIRSALSQYPKAQGWPLEAALYAMLTTLPQNRPSAQTCLAILNGQAHSDAWRAACRSIGD
ncbi:kinase-like domain-containing protein [Syncephalis pseudoplumigaleata]|uniref:Kinase-like domain-containing protein n=1 Tax=Syncephalis pseudoplumigaleata TaxID=1712513 RepID=A0A4P9Z437_9FUNG|nr:kinase-like domain-containing protein [Syncephalis pseudoplumigaleata]|eukprot:RKP26310.1 kinase-like domain-containing protein [Syncephalis pseudoplumigaleata]